MSPATISRYLARAGLVTPAPRKRPKSSYLRFAAELPNECWQSDFTHYPLAGGADLHIRVINAATGELLRDLTLDPSKNYQPTGRPPGPPRPPPQTENPEP